MYLLIYFWLPRVFTAVHRLSLVAASGGCSHCGAPASHCGDFSGCRPRALGTWASVAAAPGLSFVAPGYVRSPQTRDWTRIPCTGRWILNPWATRKVLKCMHIECLTLRYSFLRLSLIIHPRVSSCPPECKGRQVCLGRQGQPLSGGPGLAHLHSRRAPFHTRGGGSVHV